MSIHTLRAGLFLFLGVLVGCSSDGLGNTSADELELVPLGAGECATDRCGEYPGDDCGDWNMSDGYSDECMLECPKGGSTGAIAARFECYEVHIVSCKGLSNVVVEFKGGEHYKYDGLEGHYGTFGAGDKEIVGVWVKAGSNASGDGPGYGMRFDSDADCGDGGAGGAGGAGGDDGMGGAGGAGGTGGTDDDSVRDCKADIECPHGGKYGYIEVELECHEAHIASCKELSNVVIEFEDGEHRKYDDLHGHCATLGVGERQIAGVWVKAGSNKSGDGPGYGERFDSDAECDGTGGTGGMGGSGGEAGMGGMGGEAGMGGAGGAPECSIDMQCDDANDCTLNQCIASSCNTQDVGQGIACADGVCDGMGACVECLDANQCPGGGECMDGECQNVSDPISFATDILPYFEPGLADCVACHSGGGPKGVDLDSYANILAGGNSGPLVVPGDSTDAMATLVPKLNENHNNGPDDAGFVVILSQWIDEGALDN